MSERRAGEGGDDLRSAIAGALADDKGRAAPAAPRDGAGDAGTAADAANAAGAGAERSGDAAAAAASRAAAEGRAPGAPPGGGAPGAEDAGEPAGGEPGGEGEVGERAGAPAAAAQAPAHWSAADKATFNTLPEPAKTPFLDLYKRMESGLTPKLQRGAQLERDYGGLDQSLFTPQIRDILRGKGIAEPRQMIECWAQVEIGLVNPDTRNQVLARLIQAYQADPGEVARILGELRGFAPTVGRDGAAGAGAGNGAAAVPGGNGAPGGYAAPPAIDPRLYERLTALETETRTTKASREAAEYARAGREIETFAVLCSKRHHNSI